MLSLRIALRYFISGKSHGAVNVISGISVAGVAIATAAIVIVLSVFNGFTQLTHSRFTSIDPDLLLVAREGKVFRATDRLCDDISGIKGVRVVVPSLTERGLIITGHDTQRGVIFKGVGPGYDSLFNLDEITDYYIERNEDDTLPGAALSIGVAYDIDFRAGVPVELYTLKRIGRINPANPAGAFFSTQLGVERIIRTDQMEFDNENIIIPLDEARELLQYYDDEASGVEIGLEPGVNVQKVAKEISKVAGPEFDVLDRERQHEESYRMIAVEKWITFTMLIFILVIATFNIVSTLSLMVIEKRDNMITLRFLGASRAKVRAVFASMGVLITAVGGILGIILGVVLALAQQWGGFIKLNGDQTNLSVESYPVCVEFTDILVVFGLILAVAFATSLVTRLFTRKIE